MESMDSNSNSKYTLGDFYISNKTLPYYVNTKKGLSKAQQWVIIEGVPNKIVGIKGNELILNAFTSSDTTTYTVTIQDLDKYFIKAEIIKGCIIAPKYPFPIPCIEFDIRKKCNINSTINEKECNLNVKNILKDKLGQMIVSQGSGDCITIDNYNNFINKKIKITQHKRIGGDIFNRNARWCPPIDMTYEEFQNSNSYPAPLGIRSKDFCLPSELFETMIEMITQIYNMRNIDKLSLSKMKSKYNLEEREEHCCKYCGEHIDMNFYSSKYKSQTNYIEICHRDPQGRFLTHNIYWGHGKCNRKQGGYCENVCMLDGIKLLLLNNKITTEQYENIKSKI